MKAKRSAIGIWGAAGLAASACLSATAGDPPRSVSVSGSCVRRVIPDRGAVVVTVEARDPDAKRAQLAATRRYESLRAKVVALRLAEGEVSTAEYVSEEIREWERNRMVSKGFQTRIALRTETNDHARLGEVIEIATREGIKQIGGLQLFVSTKKMLDEKMACLKEASEQARAKAESLARALGAKVGEVLTVQENSGPEAPSPMPMFRNAVMMDAAAEAKAAPTIEPGRTEVSTTVQATFALK